MNVSVIKFPRWTKWSIFTLHVKPLDKIIQMFHPDQREGVYSTYDNCPGLKLKLKQLRSLSLTLLLLVLDVLRLNNWIYVRKIWQRRDILSLATACVSVSVLYNHWLLVESFLQMCGVRRQQASQLCRGRHNPQSYPDSCGGTSATASLLLQTEQTRAATWRPLSCCSKPSLWPARQSSLPHTWPTTKPSNHPVTTPLSPPPSPPPSLPPLNFNLTKTTSKKSAEFAKSHKKLQF